MGFMCFPPLGRSRRNKERPIPRYVSLSRHDKRESTTRGRERDVRRGAMTSRRRAWSSLRVARIPSAIGTLPFTGGNSDSGSGSGSNTVRADGEPDRKPSTGRSTTRPPQPMLARQGSAAGKSTASIAQSPVTATWPRGASTIRKVSNDSELTLPLVTLAPPVLHRPTIVGSHDDAAAAAAAAAAAEGADREQFHASVSRSTSITISQDLTAENGTATEAQPSQQPVPAVVSKDTELLDFLEALSVVVEPPVSSLNADPVAEELEPTPTILRHDTPPVLQVTELGRAKRLIRQCRELAERMSRPATPAIAATRTPETVASSPLAGTPTRRTTFVNRVPLPPPKTTETLPVAFTTTGGSLRMPAARRPHRLVSNASVRQVLE